MAIKKFLFMNESEGFVQPQGSGDTLFGLELNKLVVTLESGQTVAVDAGSGKITNVAAPVADTDAARKVDITNAQSALQSALDAEIARAQAAEQELASDLAAEASARITGDGTLSSYLSNEISRAEAAEGVIAGNLAAEITRATGAEADIASDLAAEVSRATGAETLLSNALNAEISRAQSAESTLTSNLATEVAARISGDQTLTTALAGEASTRASADQTLTTNLANEVSRATAAEGVLATDLANEISRATAAEGVLTTNLANEISRAQGAESAIATNLANEVSRATAAEGVLATDLANEISRAQAAEGVIAGNLAAEVQNRIDGDAATLASAKSYAMSLKAGFVVKAPVKAIAVSPVTLSGAQTIDGVSLVADDRVLVAAQAAGQDNGIYVVKSGAWVRAADADGLDQDGNPEVVDGMSVFVEQGDVYHDSTWVLVTNNNITLGTTALDFVRFSGLGQITAGDGLLQVGQNELKVNKGDGIDIVDDKVVVKLDGGTLSKGVDGVKVEGLPAGFKVDGQATTGGYVTAANLSAVCYPISTNVHYHDKTVMLVKNGDGVAITAKAAYISGDDGLGRTLVRVASCTSAATARVSGVVSSLGATGYGMSLYTHGPASTGASYDYNTAYYLGKDGSIVPFSGHAQSPGAGDRVIRLGYGMGGSLHVDIQDMGVKSA